MRTRAPLPARLGDSFGVAAAARLGVTRSRRDADDLLRPFPAVRARHALAGFHDVIDAYRSRLKPTHRFCGRTAMRLWGLPHPRPWHPDEPLEVAVLPDAAPPRVAGVRGRRLTPARARTVELRGVPVVDPVAAFFSCAAELSRADAVAIVDALITDALNYPGLSFPRPLTSMDELAERLELWGRFPGCARVHDALPEARPRVESPKETVSRLLIVDAGLPEPIIQHEVFEHGRFIARVDLAYPALRIAIEYEGDGHRTNAAQWRRDIERTRELERLGWTVIRLTQADIADQGRTFLPALRRALAERA